MSDAVDAAIERFEDACAHFYGPTADWSNKKDEAKAALKALLTPTITPEDERVECLFNAMRDHFDLSMCRSILADDDVLWNGPTYAAECALLYVVRDLEAAARQRAGSGACGA